jgi:O-antigen ligase
MHHPSYMAMYACFSICLIYNYSFVPKVATHIKPSWAFIYLVFLSVFILLLASKTGLISVLIIHFTALTYWIIKHKKIKAGLIAISTILMISVLGYMSSSLIQNRINELLTFSEASQANTSTSVRLTAWKTSKELIYEAPILGVGTGDAIDALDHKYLNDGEFKLLEKNLNAHNQFLQTAIQLGVVGILVLTFTIIYPAIVLWKQKYTPPLFLAFLLIVNGMTEAWLETQSGVLFFAFFSTLFWSYYQEIRIQKLPLKP